MLDGVRHNLCFDHLDLGFVNLTTNVVEFVLQAGEQQMPKEIRVHADSMGVVFRDQEAIEISDVETEPRFPALREIAKVRGFRSLRVIPLRAGHQALGVICVLRRQPGGFSTQDVRFLNQTAQLVALTLENAGMADVLRREKGRLETLLDVNAALISSLDIQRTFKEVSAPIGRVVNRTTLTSHSMKKIGKR